MASAETTVSIIFNAIDQTGSGFSSIGKGVSQFGSSLEGATQPLADLAQNIAKAETAVIAFGAAFGAVSLSKFKEFETAQISLNRQLDPTKESLEGLRKQIIDLSNQYGISSTTVLKGVTDYKQAGFSASEAIKLQEEAMRLMIAGEVDAETATRALVAAIQGFGLSVDQIPRFTEALNNVADAYGVNVQNLTEGTAALSPITKQLGFSFEETMAILTPVIELYGSGAEAADGFKTGLNKLVDDSDKVVSTLKQIGVSQEDSNGKLKSGRDIFFEVAAAIKNVDENERQRIISNLVGIEQSGRMGKAFNELIKIQGAYAVAIKETGSVQREIDAQMQSLELITNKAKVSWENLTIAVGEKLSGGAKESSKSVGLLGLALNEALKAGSFDPLLNGINAAELGFAKFIEQIAKNLPEALGKVDFSKLVASFGNLSSQFGDIFGGIDLGTPEGLAKAIQFLVDSLESLTEVSAGVVNGLTPLGKSILLFIDGFNKLPDSVKFAGGSFVGFGQTLNSLGGFIESTFGSLKNLGDALTKLSEIRTSAAMLELANSLLKLNPAASSIVGLLAASAGAAGYAVGDFLDLKEGADKLVSTLTGSKTSLGAWAYELTHGGEEAVKAGGKVAEFNATLDTINKTTGLAFKNVDEFTAAVDKHIITYDEATQTWINAGSAIQGVSDSTQAAAGLNDAWAKSVNNTALALGLVVESGKESTQAFLTLADAEKAVLDVNSATTNAFIRYEDGVYKLVTSEKSLDEQHKAVADATKKVAEETDKLTERQKIAIQHTNDLEIKLLELASNERIKGMEFAVNFKIAEVQADAQRVVAAFDEVGRAVEATQAASAQIFASLTDAFNNKNLSFLNREFLKEYAQKQQEQAQQALDDQSRLIDMQIEYMRAKTEALNRNDGLIKINADELEPELVLVLKTILEKIQLTANAEGLEMLLG